MDELTTAGLYGRQSRNSEKSISDQLSECLDDAEAERLRVVCQYQDGASASRFAKKVRDDWPKVLEDIRNHRFDVLILWESSRGDRTLTTWSQLLDLCREAGVRIRVVTHGRTYDMENENDWKTLATDGVDSAHESAKTSRRATRGVRFAAKLGRPPQGPVPYGYRRVYDPATGALVGQELRPDTAPIAKEIILRVGKSESLTSIVRDLNARKIPPPGGGATWYHQRVRVISHSEVYVGQRVHRPGRGKAREGTPVTYEAEWPALVSEEEHYAAVRVLDNPLRSQYVVQPRPGKQVHLLTYLATCSVCSAPMSAKKTEYVCRAGHVSMKREPADLWVTSVMKAYLAREDVYASLRQLGTGDDREADAARDEAARLEARLAKWRLSAARDETSPETMATIEAELVPLIKAAEQRAQRVSLPPALRDLLGPGEDVEARWADATLPARRAALAALFEIRFVPTPGRSRHAPIAERVLMASKSSN